MPHLLASLMRAIAIRILFLRKMSSRMMMTSTMARMITGRQRRNTSCTWPYTGVCVFVRVYVCVFIALTEGQPSLSDLQVDSEVSLEAQLLKSDVGPWLSLQVCILHVAVEDS